ncbi:hypothetical protein P175DRAFT_0438596 [Aspergillus ochraceoroseus IBT 24754]|uniref:Uncharacterized protein n=1 Tax=Aspergillus ochraceoroseus IBT 24754 TaxID=1392256 RepID=A0A2T5LUV0_9EURO|nr:uncharacterized protein P175DRAFT_0438596 [Aspergillus ochraceoroseus IBT 24754]PTU20059.1 hypothetical protein P175DRAFT_0438596 [Aspergillus ochraceoroseus IBT 24754]
MEDNDDRISCADSPLPSDTRYDSNEELLLLQMIEANKEPVSPNLQAVMNDNANTEQTSEKRHQSPLLMARPQSSGIDMTSFSFSKPMKSGKLFCLQPAINRSSSIPFSRENFNPNGDQILKALDQNRETRVTDLRSSTNQMKIVKRRQSEKKKTGKRLPSDAGNSQLTEEALFQQLMNRIKAREETEANASLLRTEMEANLYTLKEENRALKGKLGAIDTKLQQRTSEAKAYRSQTEEWKSKLKKVKTFVNDLGTDYQNLRGEAVHLRVTKRSLDRDRKEIEKDIADVKASLSHLTETYHGRRGCLSESESVIVALNNSLKQTEEKSQYIRAQLADEKKRSSLLELYIQNFSRSQDRKLDLIKIGQFEAMKTLQSAIVALGKDCKSSQKDIDCFSRLISEESLSLTRSLCDTVSESKIDFERWKETIRELEDRMNAIVQQLAGNIEQNSDATKNLTDSLNEQLSSIRDSLGDESALLTQLSQNETRCVHLNDRLQASLSTFEKLDTSIQILQQQEIGLSQQIEHIGASLTDTKIPERFEEMHVHISEKIGLENTLQQLSLTLKLTEERLKAQELDNTQKGYDVRQALAKAAEAELRATKLESKISALQDNIKAIEQNAKGDIERAKATSLESYKEQLEQQRQSCWEEKRGIEQEAQKVKDQLTQTQQKLIDREFSMIEKQKKQELLLAEKQERIHDLERSHAEHTSTLAKQQIEIEGFRKEDVTQRSQQTTLQSQLDEANARISLLDKDLRRVTEEAQESGQTIQADLDIAQKRLEEKGEECRRIKKELDAANSAKLSLESGKTKAKSEIHALLRRVQVSELGMKHIKQLLHRLDIAPADQPFPETLAKLEAVLSSVTPSNSNICLMSNELAQITTINPETLLDHDICEMFERQNEQRRSPCPAQDNDNACNQEREIESKSIRVPPSTLTQKITPFSSVLEDLSPSPCVYPQNEHFDISFMLTQTPEKQAPTSEPSAPIKAHEEAIVPTRPPEHTKQELDASGQKATTGAALLNDSTYCARNNIRERDSLPESLQKECDPSRAAGPVTRRNVSFETKSLGAEVEKLQVPDSQGKGSQATDVETPLLQEDPPHTNRWTYSKRQRDSMMRTPEKPPLRTISYVQEQGSHADVSRSKKAKLADTSPCLSSQARASSDIRGRKRSPAKLASGTSRTPSNGVVSSQDAPSRGTKRGGRRTRGDRYNARFNKPT